MKAKEFLGYTIGSVHNLAFYLWLVGEARKHIQQGDFASWKKEMVEVQDLKDEVAILRCEKILR